MAWFISCFLEDQTVSMVSEKWTKRGFKKCYFPKTKVASKIKKETPVDKKSGEWGLHACRILMHGRKYSTFKEAKAAEKIAQNHSTISSFENSYAAFQEARKHPKVYNDSTSAESDCEEAWKIEELVKLDAGSVTSPDKEYSYHRSDDTNGCQSSEGEDDQNCEVDDADGSDGESDDNNVISDDNSDAIASSDDENDDTDGNCGEENDHLDENFDEEDRRENSAENIQSNNVSEENILQYTTTNLESTSELQSPAGDYDFSDDRRIVRVEKLLIHACRELESINHAMTTLKIKSAETEQVVEKLVLVCKDLSVEVFACTEELKKRNGLFTDILVPDLKLTVKRRKDYKKNELALAKNKVVDNMIKYLASTINETQEKKFVVGCYNTVFDTEFLTNKVWWKSEPGKVVMKKSRILHCMKDLLDVPLESFKLKFGLVEPRKNDKEIESLIHKTCRNIKDNYRKGVKKARQLAEIEEAQKVAEMDEDGQLAEMDENDSEKAKGKSAKKAAKKAAKKNTCETAAEMDWDIEDYENYKKHKKARKAAKKANLLSEQSDRDDHTVDNPEGKRGKKRLAIGDINNDAKKPKKN